ncbi:MAG: hypothetical protein E7434_00890 [Ruminococcaceae bacterium]|nr:hypothetical protein [Oscillospiraceae bacterium]
MNPYDSQAVSAVWQRVRQGREVDALEQALSEAIALEHRAQNAYLAMARCGHGALLRSLAAQEACHARKLSALYYLLFECPPCPQRQCPPKIDDFCEAVRQAYQGELMARQRYGRLAKSYPEHRELFCCIAKQEKQHACRLQQLTEHLLRR